MVADTTDLHGEREHGIIDGRLQALEREVAEIKARHRDDGQEWSVFLVQFGELKARVESLAARMGAYLVAGSVLAGALAVLAQFVMRKMP
jgi:hypothetical protein